MVAKARSPWHFAVRLLLVFATSMACGFFVGQLPSSWLIQIGLQHKKIRILVDHPELFPVQLADWLQKETGVPIEVESYQNRDSLLSMASYFDFWIGRTCDLEAVGKSDFQIETLIPEIIQKISPDFQTVTARNHGTIPLLWKRNDKQGLEVFSLRPKNLDSRALRTFLKTILSRKFIQRWSETVDLANTYMTLDESTLDSNLKASSLRNIPFHSITTNDLIQCQPAVAQGQ